MMYSLTLLPEVEHDAFTGYSWYEDKTAGLGNEFLRSFYAGANEIPRNPMLYSVVYKEFRRRLLRRFPYVIYYKVIESSVIIVGLFHCARDPQSIIESLGERNPGR